MGFFGGGVEGGYGLLWVGIIEFVFVFFFFIIDVVFEFEVI